MLSGVHTQEDIQKTVTAFDQSIAAMLEEGTLRA